MHASQPTFTDSHSILRRISLPSPPLSTAPSTLSFRFNLTTRRLISIKASASAGPSSSSSTSVTADSKFDLSFYELLGISESGSLLEIKQAYKQLARKYHPDVSPPDQVKEYTQRFIRVQEAYETLSDPRRRAMYDRDLVRGIHLAFSARRRYRPNEDFGGQSEWKDQWQSQLSELKRRSSGKEAGEDLSWGARMRQQRK